MVSNDKGELALTNAEKHLAWKDHYERLLNEEFPRDTENLVIEDSVIGTHSQIKSVKFL